MYSFRCYNLQNVGTTYRFTEILSVSKMKHLFKDKTVKMDKVVKMDKMVKADLEDKAAKVDLVATGLAFPTAMEALNLEEMEEVAVAVAAVAAVAVVEAARSNFVIKAMDRLDTNALFILTNKFPFWS